MKQNIIYKDITSLLENRSPELSKKLSNKLKTEEDPIDVLKYMDKIANKLVERFSDKKIKDINESLKLIDKTCTRKIFKEESSGLFGGGAYLAPYNFNDIHGRNENITSTIDYSSVDFDNNIAKQGMTSIFGGKSSAKKQNLESKKLLGLVGGSFGINNILQNLGNEYQVGGTQERLLQNIAKYLVKQLKKYEKQIEKNAKYAISAYILMKIKCFISKSKIDNKLYKFIV